MRNPATNITATPLHLYMLRNEISHNCILKAYALVNKAAKNTIDRSYILWL